MSVSLGDCFVQVDLPLQKYWKKECNAKRMTTIVDDINMCYQLLDDPESFFFRNLILRVKAWTIFFYILYLQSLESRTKKLQ